MPPTLFRPTKSTCGSAQVRPSNVQVAKEYCTLEKVNSVLDHCQSPATAHLAKLINQDHIMILNEESYAKYIKHYGGGDWDVPVLLGEESIARTISRSSVEQIQSMVRMDMASTGALRLWPAAGTIGESQAQAERLVAGIVEPKFQGQGYSIRNLNAPGFTSMLCNNLTEIWRDDGIIRRSTVQATVMPSKGTIDIVHHEQWTISTLMTGTRVLLVFAPTKQNLRTLCSHYEQIAAGTQPDSWSLINNLEGGIAFVQETGDTAYIAPFCCFAIFSISTSTSADRYITIATDKYLMRLENLHLQLAWNQLHQDNFQQRNLENHMEILAKDLIRIMSRSIPDYDATTTIDQICKAWDGVKKEVIRACRELWDDKVREEVFESFETAWLRVLVKSKFCPICAREMVAADTKSHAGKALAHFTFVHWRGVEAPEPRATRSMAVR